MGFDILLAATLEALLGVLAHAGLSDKVEELRNRLKKRGKQSDKRLAQAFEQAKQNVSNAKVRTLIEDQTVQETITSALLDPTGFDVKVIEPVAGEDFLEIAPELRHFFTRLEATLLGDPVWGPTLSRIQQLRYQEEVLEFMKRQGLQSVSEPLVKQVSAELHGAGGIAQGAGAKAVGQQGLLVEGNVHQIVQIVVQRFVSGEDQDEQGRTLRQRYLKEVAHDANILPWSVLHQDFADPQKGADFKLADIFTPLDTNELQRPVEHEEDYRKMMAKQDMKRLSAQEMADRESRLLVMGDPGSGKTTLVKHLVYIMARALLSENPDPWLAQIQPWQRGALIPVKIELREVEAFAGDKKKGSASLLLSYLHNWLKETELGEFWKELEGAIRDAKNPLLIILDGLDEVHSEQRQLLIDCVNDFAERYTDHRYIVTCRPYAYLGQPWKLKDFKEVTLAPFSQEQIGTFVKNWYNRLAQQKRINSKIAHEKTTRLLQAVRYRDLRPLAERPLLLTVMTQLHTFQGKLPEDRTQLYDDTVDLLLHRWETTHIDDNRGVLEAIDPDLKMSDLKAGLYDVAFRAHNKMGREDDAADIEEGNLVQWLAPYFDHDRNKAAQFVQFIRERAGLLIRHRSEAYIFPHRTFQEFLAACYLAIHPDFPRKMEELIKSEYDRWREVFLLAVGYAARTQRLAAALDAVNRICPSLQTTELTADNLRFGQLAAEALYEIGLLGVRRDSAGQTLLDRVQYLLRQSLRTTSIEAKQRARSGVVLAPLPDPRPAVMELDKMQFCFVPAGPFVMGSDKEFDDNADSDEMPQKKLDLPAFYLARYPVTQTQFRAFIKDGGYAETAFWQEARKHGLWQDGKFDGRTALYRYGTPFDLDNHPVGGVTWYEALAFTRWLDNRWCAKGFLSKDYILTLPAESQWEKAARGGLKIPAAAMQVAIDDLHKKATQPELQTNPEQQRIYPWGNEPGPEKANYDETEIGATSAVDCFPGGASPYGCEEMSGNVWEWCMTKWRDSYDEPEDNSTTGEDERVVRGGSYINDRSGVRCSFRGGVNPDSRGGGIGFRLALSPTSEL